MTLYLPFGPPASGKSHLVKLAVQAGLVPQSAVISTDGYREILTDQWWCQEENKTTFEIVFRLAVTRLRRGLDVWLDATNLSGTGPYIEAATTYGHDIKSILFTTSATLCLRRNSERDHPVPWDQPEDPMFTMLKSWMSLKLEDLPGEATTDDVLRDRLTYMAKVGG